MKDGNKKFFCVTLLNLYTNKIAKLHLISLLSAFNFNSVTCLQYNLFSKFPFSQWDKNMYINFHWTALSFVHLNMWSF